MCYVGRAWEQVTLNWTSLGRVEWPGKAADARSFVSSERLLEHECGRKIRVHSLRAQRNNIPMRHRGDKVFGFVDYSPGFHTRKPVERHNPSMAAAANDLVNDGVNYRPTPSYEEKKRSRMYQDELSSVLDLAAPVGGEDSEDEAAA